MTRRRVLLVVNPAARRAARRLALARAALDASGVSYDVATTARPGHATALARERAPGCDAVLSLGGDGTAMEVITALAGSGPPVGVLPGGTANVLARTLGVPASVRRAVPALLAAPEARLDLGRLADGRHFAIGLGVGLDASMIAAATAPLKRRVGTLAYAIGALRAGLRLERFPLRLTVDDTVVECTASAVLVANFGSVASGWFTFGGGILHDDGLLNACVFTPRTHLDAVRILLRLLRRGPANDRHVRYLTGRRFRIECTPSRAAQADGELVGYTPMEIEVVPGAGRVLVPMAQNAMR